MGKRLELQKVSAQLQEIFVTAVDAVSGKMAVKKAFAANQYSDQYHVLAIGKAAESMLHGVPTNQLKSALVISKHDHISDSLKNDSAIICIESDHPIPKASSIKAGEILLNYLAGLPASEPCLFLISGGASSLVEVLEEGWNLLHLQELTDYLLSNAYPIEEMNVIRKQISKIKGGDLWSYLKDRDVICLMISDVADDDPKIIGSGLLFPSAEQEGKDIPPSFYTFYENSDRHNFPAFPVKKAVTQNQNFKWEVIASLSDAKHAAAQKAISLGYQIEVMDEFLNGEASQVAEYCVDRLLKVPNVLHIWGGETTVHLPKNAGKGGRNQHLALAAAIDMKQINSDKEIMLLSAGTDGTDGLTDATGAIVDHKTVDDIKEASRYLVNADSNHYFLKQGGLIKTGATGTNVMDLVLGISLS